MNTVFVKDFVEGNEAFSQSLISTELRLVEGNGTARSGEICL